MEPEIIEPPFFNWLACQNAGYAMKANSQRKGKRIVWWNCEGMPTAVLGDEQ